MNRPAGRNPPYASEIRGRNMTSCRWTFEFWSLKAVVAGGIVIRLWTSWRTAEAAAKTLNQLRNAMFGKRTQGFETSRFPSHATVVLMQGLYRSTVAWLGNLDVSKPW